MLHLLPSQRWLRETSRQPLSRLTNFAAASDQEFQEYLPMFVLHRHLELRPFDSLHATFVQALAHASAHDDRQYSCV
jgi:hypothetical protein